MVKKDFFCSTKVIIWTCAGFFAGMLTISFGMYITLAVEKNKKIKTALENQEKSQKNQ